MMAPVVVMGAGLAGWTTVSEFRKLDAPTPVLLVTADSGEELAASCVLSAIGLRVDRAIVVDTRLQTSADGVYALGDAGLCRPVSP
jgi:rubredoxin-NAD+ reductase